MVVMVQQDFEAITTPLKNSWNGFIPGFAGDIGDGEAIDPDVAVMWVIASNDDPALGRLPPQGFIQGNKCVYGQIKADIAGISTEDFLNRQELLGTYYKGLYVRWYEAFDVLESWLPIFWNKVVKMQGSTVLQYTNALVIIGLSGTNSIVITVDSDSGLNLSGATTLPQSIVKGQWYKFEFYHYIDAVNGVIWIKVNDVVIFSFTGNTVPKTGQEPSIYYTQNNGFEVGMQRPGGTGPNKYWLDDVYAADTPPGAPIQHPVTIDSELDQQPIAVPVTVDQQPIGNTPVAVMLTEGQHTIEVPEELTI